MVLRAADGRNIQVSGAGGFGLSDQSAVGNLTVTGTLAEGAAADLKISGNNPGNAGFSVATVAAVDTGDPVYVPLEEADGYDQNPNLQTADGATSTILIMDRKLTKLLALRGRLGAAQNVLAFRAGLLSNARDGNAQTRSRIVDADFAVEMANLTRERIIQSSGLAMIAQSNVNSARILVLLMRTT